MVDFLHVVVCQKNERKQNYWEGISSKTIKNISRERLGKASNEQSKKDSKLVESLNHLIRDRYKRKLLWKRRPREHPVLDP